MISLKIWTQPLHEIQDNKLNRDQLLTKFGQPESSEIPLVVTLCGPSQQGKTVLAAYLAMYSGAPYLVTRPNPQGGYAQYETPLDGPTLQTLYNNFVTAIPSLQYHYPGYIARFLKTVSPAPPY